VYLCSDRVVLPRQAGRNAFFGLRNAFSVDLSIIEGSFLTKPKNLPLARAHRYRIRAAICEWLCPDLRFTTDGVLLARVLRTEEKGSDVNLAAHLINDAHAGRFDEAIVVSGDSDLCDAIKIVV